VVREEIRVASVRGARDAAARLPQSMEQCAISIKLSTRRNRRISGQRKHAQKRTRIRPKEAELPDDGKGSRNLCVFCVFFVCFLYE
jgi:hypothetical protein